MLTASRTSSNKTGTMIHLTLKRIAKKDTYTIGRLYINGEYFCDTLEDTDRGLSAAIPVDELKKMKVYGRTAIPTGIYRVSLRTVSEKFRNKAWARPYGGRLPRLLDVPAYEGVLIHVGNTPEDTLGCILVGENKQVGKVVNSTSIFNRLMARLQPAAEKDEDVYIQIA